jgi:hypothetical protein
MMYLSVVAGAGNETTTKLIGWAGRLLADHPDQRLHLAEDPAHVTAAVEELLRYAPASRQLARLVTSDVEWYGRTVPAGAPIIALVGAANREDRRWDDAEHFDAFRPSYPTSPQATASTSASGRPSLASRPASPSKRSSPASPTRRSTNAAPASPRPRRCAATTDYRSSSPEAGSRLTGSEDRATIG